MAAGAIALIVFANATALDEDLGTGGDMAGWREALSLKNEHRTTQMRRSLRIHWYLLLLVACSPQPESPPEKSKAVPEPVSTQAKGLVVEAPERGVGDVAQPPNAAIDTAAMDAVAGFGFGSYEQFRPIINGVYADFYMVAIGDLTGDRRDDVVATGARELFVFLQNSDGTLTTPQVIPLASINYAMSLEVVLADFNEDGRLDALTQGVSPTGTGLIHALLSNPTGGAPVFRSGVASAFEGSNWVALDADGDGHKDLVGRQNIFDYTLGKECGYHPMHYCPRYHILYGDGWGAFPRKATVKVGLPRNLSFLEGSDVNGDGLDDLVLMLNDLGDSSLASVHVQYRSPSGGFGPLVKLHDASGGLGNPISFADFNGDGRRDSLFLSGLRHQSAAGQFNAAVDSWLPIWGGWDYPGQHVSDLDRDRQRDVIVRQLKPIPGTPYSEPGLGIYLQQGGELQLQPFVSLAGTTSISTSMRPFATGDINGDRCTDLIVAAGYGGLLTLKGHGCKVLVPTLPDETGTQEVVK